MRHNWAISKKDIELVKQVCLQQSTHKIYKEREQVNIGTKNVTVTKELLWKCIFTCLLTTQQRSTADSRINQFIRSDYSSINLKKLSEVKNVEKYLASQLQEFGGIRRNKIIPKEAATIYTYLEETDWKLLKTIKELTKQKGNKALEREICNEIVSNKDFKGLGPKQSRNLLQMLGLTIYEIPIDSRITDWINANELFPFRLNSKGLSDIEFYCFLNDAIIELCEKAKTKPCLFDAAVFSLNE